jgi:aspartate/glutamate racemase
MIYEIKGMDGDLRHIRFVEGLLERYGVSSYIAGCTELHILAKQQERVSGRDRREFCIDPLTAIGSLISQTSTTIPAVAAS